MFLLNILEPILGPFLRFASNSIYYWHCSVNKNLLNKQLPTEGGKVFYQCDYDKAIAVNDKNNKLGIFQLSDDDSLEKDELPLKDISKIDIIEDSNYEGDCKYVRLQIVTCSYENPQFDIIFLKPMNLSGKGSFCKDSRDYQSAIKKANQCKKYIESLINIDAHH